MSKYCPIYDKKVLYLDCLECEEKECHATNHAPLKKGSVTREQKHPSEIKK